MMRLIDTHAHLYDEAFDADRDEVLARARAAGVERILLPAIDFESYERLFDLCRARPGFCIPMMGLHPTSVNENPLWLQDLARVESYLESPPEGIGSFCAVGEIGLDFYWSRDFVAQQREAFIAQLGMASRYGLPVVIHVRDAWEETMRIIRQEAQRLSDEGMAPMRGVFHAFSGDSDIYGALCALGDFVFGIGGVVTFKKSLLADVVRGMDLDRIVLETDCPYLTPAPHRGERNEPAYIAPICEKVADIKGVTADAIAAAATANTERIFRLGAAHEA